MIDVKTLQLLAALIIICIFLVLKIWLILNKEGTITIEDDDL